MPPRKRGVESLPGALLPDAGRHDALTWLQDTVGLSQEAVKTLDELWEQQGELVDGETLHQADEGLLVSIGVSRAVATKILKKLHEQRAPTTQALAPTTQQANRMTGEPEQQQQKPAEERRGRSRTPAATQGAGSQQQRQIPIKPDPEEWEQQLREEQQQQSQEPRRSRRQRSQPPDEEEEEEASARQRARRSSGTPSTLAGGDEDMADADDEEEHEDEEEEDGEEEGMHTPGSRLRSGSMRIKPEPGAAVEEHSVPLTGGRGGRRGASRQPVQKQEPRDVPMGPSQQQQQHAQQGDGGAGPSRQQQDGDGPPGGTNDDDAGPSRRTRAGARQMRMSTMQERQRRQEQEVNSEDEEEEDEAAAAAAAADAAAAAAAAAGGDVETEDEDGEPWSRNMVTEDLGPEAGRHYYQMEWKRNARHGMFEIFSSMTVQQLHDLVDSQEHWPDFARNCLRHKKRVEGVMEWADIKQPRAIAAKLVNFCFTGSPDGRETDDNPPMDKKDLRQLLRDNCDAATKRYVENKLKLRYQNMPAYVDHHKVMWRLWSAPVGFRPTTDRDVVENPVLLGKKTMRYAAIQMGDANLETQQRGYVPWRSVNVAIESGQIVLEGENEDAMLDDRLWCTQVNDLSTHKKCRVSVKLIREPGNRKIVVYLFQLFDKVNPSTSLISGTWEKPNAEGDKELVNVDMLYLLSRMDGMPDTPFMHQMEQLADAYNATDDEVRARGLETELGLDSPMNLKQFDKVMALVEDLDRGEPEGFEAECDDAFLLKLRPYQRRSLAHMLREERAAATATTPGGSARHLWVKLNLDQHPDVHCFVSPILHQIRTSTSKIEAEKWVGANGGAGWIALQMGMGKTACAVGAIQLNPPPQGWRKNRAYQSARMRDHLSATVNNMPHGGTLIVCPPTLVDQWEDEARKTTDKDLSILKWTDSTARNPRVDDCREIAKYDIVLTTFQLASNLHVLSAIRWWRIVVDEPQLQAGGFLQDKEHTWFANNRWLLTGTPVNHAVDTLSPSMEFLGLGSFDALYAHTPPVAAHVLKTFLVRYTKKGRLDGEENLALPPITYDLVECQLGGEDRDWYVKLQREQKLSWEKVFNKLHIPLDMVGEDLDPNWEYNGKPKVRPPVMMKLRSLLNPLRQAASSALKQPTGEENYDDTRGRFYKKTYWYTAKAQAVIEVLEEKAPDEKVLVFSEFPNTLRQIKSMLPEIGLQSRDLIGGSSAAARGKAIRDFQTDPPTKVFLLTHRAGGAGITLTAGTHIVLCEPTLNPSFERQAIGRSHRMGQTRPVKVTRMLMKRTVEEKVAEFVSRQVEEEEEDPLEAPESTAMEANLASHDETNKLSVEDLRDMIYDADLLDEDDE